MAIDKILTKTININAKTSKVWDALTNPDIIKQWLFGTNVISDWKVGSLIFFTGNWQGTDYKDKGTILQFEKEKIFQYNYWSGFSGLPDSPENYSTISFMLAPANNSTQLTLTQNNFATETAYEHTEQNWKATLDLMKNIIEKQTDL
jgi:uncharacterized protein YndB with AHSA1/START domain